MLNILLLEDEEGIRSFIKVNLLREGYNVYEAGCSERALDIIENHRIDIALLDVMLPDLSGFEVLKKVREEDSDIGVIMLTAKSMEEDKIEGLSLGADDYITKPFSPKELILRIKSLARRLISYKLDKNNIKTKNFTLCVDERNLYKNGNASSLTFPTMPTNK